MRSLYLIPLINSTATHRATNSEPKVDVSTVFCAFEYQRIGALFMYRRMPVCDRRLILFLAWLASQNTFSWTGIPLGGGAFGGRSSEASL